MKRFLLYSIWSFLLIACSDSVSQVEEIIEQEDTTDITQPSKKINLLSLGDSYTIGESVCFNCKFPVQLKDSLINKLENQNITLKVIARTGWTTTNLINAINSEELDNTYNLVTLLIGVNNQYQGKDFSIYQNELPQLISTAISLANNNKEKVIVISIPDYAYTPFGRGDSKISEEIDSYNSYAKTYCESQNISYINITDITRNGLTNPNLVAYDGLHPSELAYTKFVERILPVALEKIQP